MTGRLLLPPVLSGRDAEFEAELTASHEPFVGALLALSADLYRAYLPDAAFYALDSARAACWSVEQIDRVEAAAVAQLADHDDGAAIDHGVRTSREDYSRLLAQCARDRELLILSLWECKARAHERAAAVDATPGQ